jgi:predicted neuraminidase
MFIFEKAPFPSCHASTLVETEPGIFLAAWFGGKDEGMKDVKIWSAHFDGKKWSPPVIAAKEDGVPCWNPVLFISQSKTLFLFYKAGLNPMSWTAFVQRSKDGGKTWDKPHKFPAGLLGPIKNKPIQRADGAILAGSSVESYKDWVCWIERSTDDCKTWKRFGPITVEDNKFGIIQPTLFETTDKRIVALCRSDGLGYIVQTESKDGGETWSTAIPTELPNPDSGIDLVQTKKGRLFLVYNHTKTARSPLNIALSDDEGKTWKKAATLEDQPGEFSYPAVIEGQDGLLHITYTWNRRHIKYVTADPSKLKS